jgi:hypothetical protein
VTGLFVPLDVNYADDDKIIDAGPMAELLYVRSLAFVKRARTNGDIAANQIPLIGARITRPRALAERLVEVGLWERTGSGLYVSAWLKRNAPVETISAVKADAGSVGAHIRWHVKRRQPDPSCEHCVREQLVDPMAAG